MRACLPATLPCPRAAAAGALAAILALGPVGHPAAQPVPEFELGRLFSKLIVQAGLGFARGAVELTYDGIAVDPRSGEITITGLVLRPRLPHDEARACEIGIERVTLADGGRFDRVDGALSLGGVSLPAACLEPEPAELVSALGFPVIEADTVAIDLAYDDTSSALSIDLVAGITNGALITAAADFEYFWFQGVSVDEEVGAEMTDDAELVAILSGAEIMVENRGLFEALEPMIGQQLGDPAAIPAIAQAGLMQALTQEGGRTPTPEEIAFVEELSTALGRFVEEKDRVVVTLAPGAPVRLGEDAFEDPAAAIALLSPRVGAAPAARQQLVAPALLAKASNDRDALSEAERMTVGRAFLTGIGAPRARRDGVELLTPLAEGGSGEAALLVAKALAAEGDPIGAYANALIALAAGESAAAAIADDMEAILDLSEILSLQNEVAPFERDGELVEAADVAGMHALAERLVSGRGGPRNYETALYWATLASASGDRGAAALLRRLDSRYARRAEEAETWANALDEASARALETWIEGGLAERVAVE
ncbi:MAG: hypothetical protein AAF371_09450 [Pseudomonadota bacterium]